MPALDFDTAWLSGYDADGGTIPVGASDFTCILCQRYAFTADPQRDAVWEGQPGPWVKHDGGPGADRRWAFSRKWTNGWTEYLGRNISPLSASPDPDGERRFLAPGFTCRAAALRMCHQCAVVRALVIDTGGPDILRRHVIEQQHLLQTWPWKYNDWCRHCDGPLLVLREGRHCFDDCITLCSHCGMAHILRISIAHGPYALDIRPQDL